TCNLPLRRGLLYPVEPRGRWGWVYPSSAAVSSGNMPLWGWGAVLVVCFGTFLMGDGWRCDRVACVGLSVCDTNVIKPD
ncbi:MAG: hypothetical protein ACPG7W_04105, partial [Paracoccaceae bacterium]